MHGVRGDTVRALMCVQLKDCKCIIKTVKCAIRTVKAHTHVLMVHKSLMAHAKQHTSSLRHVQTEVCCYL